MKKVYFSLPVLMQNRDKIFQELAQDIREANATAEYWKEDEYYQQSIIGMSDVFVFGTQYNDFNMSHKVLPSGVAKELDKAIALNKEIFLLYKSSSAGYQYYRVTMDGTYIRGIAGSTGEFWKVLEGSAVPVGTIVLPAQADKSKNSNVTKEQIELIESYHKELLQDKRLLLPPS